MYLDTRLERYLVEGVIQTLIEIIKVAQDDRLANLHRELDAIDVQTDLTILLIIGEARAKDNRSVCQVQKFLEKVSTLVGRKVYKDAFNQILNTTHELS